jgi:hypothetical protein
MTTPPHLRLTHPAFAAEGIAKSMTEIERSIRLALPHALMNNAILESARSMERYRAAANSLLGASIAAAQQRMLTETRRSIEASLTTASLGQGNVLRHQTLGLSEGVLSAISRSLELSAESQRGIQSAVLESIRRFSELTEQPWFKIAQEVKAQGDLMATFSGGVAGSWGSALDPRLMSRMQAAVHSEVEENPTATIREVIVAAVVDALPADVKSDTRFIANLVLLLLTILAGWIGENATEAENSEQLASFSWHADRVAARSQILILQTLMAREVIHGARLWAGPSFKSRVLGRIYENARVISIRRKGRFTQVLVRAQDAPGGVAVTAWMLNKYLERR